MSALSIETAADEAPDRAAQIRGERVVSYRELAGEVRRRRGALHALGLAAGDRIALVARPEPSSIATILAAVELGAPVVLLHPRWTPAEREQAIAITRPTRVLDGDPAELDRPIGERADASGPPPADGALAIVFTSGSSGDPRPVVLSRRAFLHAARASSEVLGWRDDDAWHCAMPLAHVGGLSVVVRALVARRAISLGPEGPFDPVTFVAALEASRATLASVVPTMLARLVEASLPPPRSIRAVLCGGAACPPRTLRSAAALGWPIRTTYGLTEACAQVATARRNVADETEGCGPPLPGVDVRIAGERILVRSPSAMDGWLGPDGTLVRPFDAEGFYDTGDDGRLDDGCLHVLGRRADLVVTGGENVRPGEVEAALERVPGVRAACVVGVPDEVWGAVVGAAIVADPGTSDSDIVHALRDRLAAFKLPRRILRVAALPTSTIGKPDRRRTLALFARPA